MPSDRSNATPPRAGHQRTRSDHASETAEDYVEAIAELIERCGACRVRDLAERFGVSHVTVVRTVGRLESEGLVRTEPYRPIELTARGRRLARACRERHEIVYRFLLAIGVPARVAAVDAEGLEHHVSKATLERFRAIASGGLPDGGPDATPADR
ncbi:MAG: transcriptional regulator MntR [Phycisphaerales bacterium]|nr:MAG: transcriptional regulator MntR [Phycisphaerales bacterium]